MRFESVPWKPFWFSSRAAAARMRARVASGVPRSGLAGLVIGDRSITNMSLREAAGTGQERRYIVLFGVRLAWEDGAPDRAPCVCLHAIGHGAGDYASFRARVGDRLRVI